MNVYLQKNPKRVNAVSVTLTLVALGGGYLLWFWLPAYWPVFQLTGIMRGACNDAYRIVDNDEIIKKLLVNARRTGLRLSKENFRMTRTRYSDEELRKLPGGMKTDVWAKKGKTCVIEMHYENDYTWPLIGKTQRLVFERTVEAELSPVIWDKGGGSFPDCRCVSLPGRSSGMRPFERSL